jgi:hypothetical protein
VTDETFSAAASRDRVVTTTARLIAAGFTPRSVRRAVRAGDVGLLRRPPVGRTGG